MRLARLDFKSNGGCQGAVQGELSIRINATDMIAGFPARQVRRLMRETLGREISVPWVMHTLQCAEPVAERVLAELERKDLVQHVGGHLEPSLRGSALA